MSQINLSALPDKDLAELISAAMTEWAARQAPTVVTERRSAPTVTVTINEPGDQDKDFCLYVANLLRRGEYIRSADRRRVAEIAESYGPWVLRQGLPDTHNAGDWQRARGKTLVGRAVER